jgi:hypothetical protein
LFEIDNSASLNKKSISESRAWRKEQKGANISNHGDSWHSPDGLMMRSDPGFSEIWSKANKPITIDQSRVTQN